MTYDEYKKLKRADLIEIIYQLQMDVEDLKRKNEKLQESQAGQNISREEIYEKLEEILEQIKGRSQKEQQ